MPVQLLSQLIKAAHYSVNILVQLSGRSCNCRETKAEPAAGFTSAERLAVLHNYLNAKYICIRNKIADEIQ